MTAKSALADLDGKLNLELAVKPPRPDNINLMSGERMTVRFGLLGPLGSVKSMRKR
jgi:hypothetical protein